MSKPHDDHSYATAAPRPRRALALALEERPSRRGLVSTSRVHVLSPPSPPCAFSARRRRQAGEFAAAIHERLSVVILNEILSEPQGEP